MKKLVLVLGKVVHVTEKETAKGKKYYIYQVESESDRGKSLGNVISWEKRDFKNGDDVKVVCFENNRIWNEKVYTDTIMLSADREKKELTAFAVTFNQPQTKMKV